MSLQEEILDAVIDGVIGNNGTITRQEVMQYFHQYSRNYTGGILSKSEIDRDHIPMLFGGFTDGRFFSRIGIQTYGYLPMQLPEDFNFTQTIQAADERIPIHAIEFGTNAIYQALQRFGV